MREEDLRRVLSNILREAQSNPALLSRILVRTHTPRVATMRDLTDDIQYQVFEDTSEWNREPRLMVDLSGGTTPDIVIRSKASDENRICIEVKLNDDLKYGVADSQAVRYFLHLLATSRKYPGRKDIRRAMLLAAPTAWFSRQAQRPDDKWPHFLATYRGLADAFDIVVGEIHTDTLADDPQLQSGSR